MFGVVLVVLGGAAGYAGAIAARDRVLVTRSRWSAGVGPVGVSSGWHEHRATGAAAIGGGVALLAAGAMLALWGSAFLGARHVVLGPRAGWRAYASAACLVALAAGAGVAWWCEPGSSAGDVVTAAMVVLLGFCHGGFLVPTWRTHLTRPR